MHMLHIDTNLESNVALLKFAQLHNFRNFPLIGEPDEQAARETNKEIYPVWTTLQSALPVDCRRLIYGRTSLVAPKSGAILAMTLGTACDRTWRRMSCRLRGYASSGTRWSKRISRTRKGTSGLCGFMESR